MKKKYFIAIVAAIIFLALCPNIQAQSPQIYIVLYATHDGNTGHVGLAVDCPKVKIMDCQSCDKKVKFDTLISGSLQYFDIWPTTDFFSSDNIGKDVKPVYFHLPNASSEVPITLSSLMRKGLPHKLNKPCDGLLAIPSNWLQIKKINAHFSYTASKNKKFNPIYFNCADFIGQGLNQVLGLKMNFEERILGFKVDTPNKLFNVLKQETAYQIIKDPKDLTDGSFLVERILTGSIQK